ncbi:MAG: hypothetical protein HFG67_02145, partial [Firmicutes bacterium]|nr:hypothetical protein [Bacillota bacterium]
MKNIKKFGTLFLIVIMLFTTAITACATEYENNFTDVTANSWYADAVKYCDENGLMNGTEEGKFSPNSTMTREMLAAVLYRQAGSPNVSGSDNFPDTAADTWYTGAVIWASQQEIITGYSDGRFGTGDFVTREQAVTMLWRLAGRPETGTDVQIKEFADQASISSYAKEAAAWASANGVINGRQDNKFDPKAKATRAEMAVILMNNAKFTGSAQGGANNETLPAQQGNGNSGSTGSAGSSGGNGGSSSSGSGSGTAADSRKVLIAYFSATNNTESIANHINTVLKNDNIDADIYEIVPQVPYTSADLNYNDDSSRVSLEHADPAVRPAISGSVTNMKDYDTIFLGYPIWWGQAPNIVYNFVESYDFTNKTIIPFCTAASSGIGSSAENLSSAASSANWLTSAGIRFRGSALQSEVAIWLKGLDIYESMKNEAGADTDNMGSGKLYIRIAGTQNVEWTATLAENSSAEALRELLLQ